MLEKPSKRILTLFNGTAYLFALLVVASAIAWIYYVAKAVDAGRFGGTDGFGINDDAAFNEQIDSVDVMFEGVIIAVIFYHIGRHHFRCHE